MPTEKLISTETFTPIVGLEVESLPIYNTGQSLDFDAVEAVYIDFY